MRDVGPLMNQPQPFQILKMDRRRGNIVVSRRAVLEERRAEERTSLVASLAGEAGRRRRGQEHHRLRRVRGSRRRRRPAARHRHRVAPRLASDGSSLRRPDRHRADHQDQPRHAAHQPRHEAAADRSVGRRRRQISGRRDASRGKVTNVTDYGAFVELEPGVEGLVHVSEMCWVKKNVAPSKIVDAGHGSRSAWCWKSIPTSAASASASSRRRTIRGKRSRKSIRRAATIEGEIKSITEFGLFVGLDSDIDGMVHLSDLSWDKSGEEAVKAYEKGQMVKAQVLDVDPEKERVSLGIKQLGDDPMEKAGAAAVRSRRASVVTVTVTEVNDGGIEVALADGVKAFIRRSRPRARPRRSAPRTFRQGRQGRCARHLSRQGEPQDLALDQGARNLRREGSRGAIRLVGLGRFARRHPRRRAEEGDEEGRQESRRGRRGRRVAFIVCIGFFAESARRRSRAFSLCLLPVAASLAAKRSRFAEGTRAACEESEFLLVRLSSARFSFRHRRHAKSYCRRSPGITVVIVFTRNKLRTWPDLTTSLLKDKGLPANG